MHYYSFLIAILFALCPYSSSAEAMLIDEGSGLIYDTDLNITWTKDANIPWIKMNWDEATSWVDNLVLLGYDDWRLPRADPTCGTNYFCTESEFGHLYYSELGNAGSLINPGPFTNIPWSTVIYWTETVFEDDHGSAWNFYFEPGYQSRHSKDFKYYVWAVRDGDTAPVPEPESALLICAGILMILVLRSHVFTGRSPVCVNAFPQNKIKRCE